MDIKQLKIAAYKYFEGRLDNDEAEKLLEFIASSPFNKIVFDSWKKEWLAESNHTNSINEWQSMVRRIQIKERNSLQKKGFRIKWSAMVAASIILLLGISFFLWMSLSSNPDQLYYTYEVPNCSKSCLTMPDGTIVWLNAGSTLRYPHEFNKKNRRVELNGEGYFHVINNQNEDFVVSTRGYDVVVKGTRFNVSAYDNDDRIVTTLIDGKVLIQAVDKSTMLLPDQSMTYDIVSNLFEVKRTDTSQTISWMDNNIDYDEISLRDLSKVLERQFGVKIVIQSEEIANVQFRISLRNQEQITDVLESLKNIIPISVIREGKLIYIE